MPTGLMVNEVRRPNGTLAEKHYYDAGVLSWKEYYYPNGTTRAKTEFYRYPNNTITLQTFYRPDGTTMMRCTYSYTGDIHQTTIYDRNGILRKVLTF